MKGLWLLIIGLIIGIVVGYWLWHGRPGGNTPVNNSAFEVQAVGKTFLYAQKGDILKWAGADGKPLPVTFQFGSPCKEEETSSTCEIVATSGYFKYTCPMCLDPGVRVGSHGMTGSSPGRPPTVGSVGAKGATDTAEPPDPFVYCDPRKNNATVQSVRAHVNDKVQWFPASQISGQKWQVTVAAGVCNEGNVFAPPSPTEPTGICTVLKSATYDVEADACQIHGGTGQLTVQ